VDLEVASPLSSILTDLFMVKDSIENKMIKERISEKYAK